MKSIVSESIYFGMALSIFAYLAGTFIRKRLGWRILNPLLISILLVIGVLVFFHIDYDSYNNGAKYLSYLLTPATVCLAVPLYQQLELLTKNLKAVVIGIGSGVMASLSSILVMSVLFHLSHTEYVTLLPKSITTAIGIGISKELNGITTIAVSVIIITGVLGNVIAEQVCRMFGIKNPIAKGLAIGTASHAIGTSKAMEIGQIEGAMSSLAIAVAGLMTVLLAPIFAQFY